MGRCVATGRVLGGKQFLEGGPCFQPSIVIFENDLWNDHSALGVCFMLYFYLRP